MRRSGDHERRSTLHGGQVPRRDGGIQAARIVHHEIHQGLALSDRVRREEDEPHAGFIERLQDPIGLAGAIGQLHRIGVDAAQ